MKMLATVFGIATSLLVAIYLFLFTSLGHGYLIPKVETTLKDATQLTDIKVTSFDLGPGSIKTSILIEGSPLEVDGTFSLLDKTINATYNFDIKDLSKFQTLTKIPLQGELSTNGKVIGFIENLLVQGVSNVANGDVNYDLTMKNSKIDLVAKAKDVQSIPLMQMLGYPQIFDSKINGILNYNIITKQGNSDIDLSNGKFLTNEALTTIKNLTSYDLTLEVYEDANIKTQINNDVLTNKIAMKSKRSTISSEKLVLNTTKSTVDGEVNVAYDNLGIVVGLNGAIAKPKVSINANKALKEKAKAKAKEEIKKAIDKKLGDKIDDKVKGLLKGLF
jgi:hypothetical protein